MENDRNQLLINDVQFDENESNSDNKRSLTRDLTFQNNEYSIENTQVLPSCQTGPVDQLQANALEETVDDEVIPGASWRDYLIEPFIFIYGFSNFLGLTVAGNLYMDRACSVDLNYTQDICSNLTANGSIQDQVQRIATGMSLYSSMITLLPGAILAMFIGPWSDMYGRIPPIIVSMIGTTLQAMGLILFCIYGNLPVHYALLASVPGGVCGGLVCVMGGIYSLTTEKSKENKRTLKYALLEGSFFISIPLSGITSGQIYNYGGILMVFYLQLGLQLLALIWCVLFIKDNRIDKKEGTCLDKFKDFFSLESMKENFRTCMRVRENYGRAQIWLLFLILCTCLVAYVAMGNLLYYFCTKMYGWDLPFYTTVTSTFNILSIIFVTILIAFITKKIKPKDAWLAIIGISSLIAQCFIRAFAYHPYLLYVSLASGIFGGVAVLAVRSRISKLVQKDEIGKVFAILAILEALFPTPVTAAFTAVYNASVSYYPGLVFLCAGIMLVPCLLISIWLLNLPTPTCRVPTPGTLYNTLPNYSSQEEITDDNICQQDKSTVIM